jgi:uncharacterized peroxidase-related enzyme
VTIASTPVALIYLADIEAGGRPGPHLNMIEAAKAQGSEYWQIWHLFAFRPEMTIHLGRFTHALMHEPGPITPALRELIAAYTSRLNNCAFCMKSHAAVTAHLFHDEGLVASVLADLNASPLPEKEKALLRFVEKVTRDSSHVEPGDIELLHQAGWEDAAIYYAITVSALFNFYNRWISANGVHAISDQGHRHHAARIAEKGYIRD